MLLRLNLFFILSLFLSAWASSESDKITQISESISKERAICKNTILKNKTNVTEIHLKHCVEIISDRRSSGVLDYYIEAYKVSPEVAKYRLGVQGEIGDLGAQVAKDEKHDAGFYIENQPNFSV